MRLPLENVRRTIVRPDRPPRVPRKGTTGHASCHLGPARWRAGHSGRAAAATPGTTRLAGRCGSPPPAIGGKLPPSRHIEVKGRARGQTTLTVTRNEILYGLNQQEQFILAIVLVEGEAHEGPYYVKKPFTQEPDWAVSSINLDLGSLLEAVQPAP